jgi:long-chain fatty acid transport protein
VFGVGFKPNDKLTLAVDLQYVFWSTYESLNFDFENNTATLQDSENIRNFENTMVYRFGAEYLVSSKLTGRIGFAYDNTPIPENYLTPETPGNDKLNFSAGLSYQVTDRLSFDASFLFIKALERKDGYAPADFYGTYNTTAVIPGFGINYSF